MKTTNLRLSLIQHQIKSDQPKKNRLHLITLIKKSLAKKPHLILLPEICLGNSPSKKWQDIYFKEYQQLMKDLKYFSEFSKVCFYGSILQKPKASKFRTNNSQTKYFNTAFFMNSLGSITGLYQKIHLFRFENEHKIYKVGSKSKNFLTPWGKMAPLICYDIRFPELLRKLVFNGAQYALVCAQWPKSRQDHWITLLKARAIENQIFIFACNRTGSTRHLTFGGGSCVISPWGEVLYSMNDKKQVGHFQINNNDIMNIRKKFPFIRDAYKKLFRFDI